MKSSYLIGGGLALLVLYFITRPRTGAAQPISIFGRGTSVGNQTANDVASGAAAAGYIIGDLKSLFGGSFSSSNVSEPNFPGTSTYGPPAPTDMTMVSGTDPNYFDPADF